MNLLVTLDHNYIPVLRVMLFSLLRANPGEDFALYIVHSTLTDADFEAMQSVPGGERLRLCPLQVQDEILAGAPIEKRYPREMYYRLFAARILPAEVDRVLYLDPDLVVLNPVRPLYEMQLDTAWFAAASHVKRTFQRLNELRLDIPEGGAYVNSGVMLMDLAALRRHQNPLQVLDYIEKNKVKMVLPDQDVLNALYHDRIAQLNPLIYNLSEKYLTLHNLNFKNQSVDLDWVRTNAVFVHYCGRNKPWKPVYYGLLDVFYRELAEQLAGAVSVESL